MKTTWKVCAGGSCLRTFRSPILADAYAREVLAHSDRNIGRVQIWRYVPCAVYGDCGAGRLVRDLGTPTQTLSN